ncbi:metallophosphoesterase family protein [Pelagicoccus sp. SDUM812003]|uniref:metallophosphoesterase family protein n=1 Tax=Pelagicoccus sp. SDUM812003 TaxID=3041267 RepID=UPI00280F7168|nr:metallophosphoesterase family protein [Pelagicoccus sp. SDUM812003]MDQ8204383.1 metallophosphoesterase family protein [Pelagicoccus sp. SDUM812003]
MKLPEIAVISDTHGSLPDRLVKRLAKADEIWHLGDVTHPSTIEPLQYLPADLAIVCGNCDPFGQWPQRLEFERGGHRFRLQHLPPSEGVSGVSAILYGHLHQPLRERSGDTLLLNPGAITSPRGGSKSSFGWLRFPEAGQWTWTIETL